MHSQETIAPEDEPLRVPGAHRESRKADLNKITVTAFACERDVPSIAVAAIRGGHKNRNSSYSQRTIPTVSLVKNEEQQRTLIVACISCASEKLTRAKKDKTPRPIHFCGSRFDTRDEKRAGTARLDEAEVPNARLLTKQEAVQKKKKN
jgi:hypothetical protein